MKTEKNAGALIKPRSNASNPTPSVSSVPTTAPRNLNSANAIDNLNISRSAGKKK